MNTVDRVHELVLPLAEAADAQIYDIEYESGVLRIMLDRPDGIDVDTIGKLTQSISSALDERDPLPDSRYLLEVTSPGIERKLRTTAHYTAVVGELVNVKLREAVDGERRFEGTLLATDDTHFEISTGDGGDAPVRRIAYDGVEAARTVFNWEEELAAKKQKSETNKAKVAKSTKATKPAKTNKKKASTR